MAEGPLMGTIWFFLLFLIFGIVFGTEDINVLFVVLGPRAIVAFFGYLIMQIGLWQAETKWDEEGSAAYLEAAGANKSSSPEELATFQANNVTIPDDKLKAAFPVPWGFLIGWWVWGLSYLFPIFQQDGQDFIDPTTWGIVALLVCLFVSFVASVPMSDAVMNRNGDKKKKLSLMFLLGWITLGIMSALDVSEQLEDSDSPTTHVWLLSLLGPITIIMSQKILFASRKMGTLWEESGKPNFRPVVYNMGGPLFVCGWFLLWLGTCSLPANMPSIVGPYFPLTDSAGDERAYIPFFLNLRTFCAMLGGCAMVPVVRFLDYSHDEDGPWLGANNEGAVFQKWWLGTDGTYFGVFLESPWPFVMAWTLFGFSSFFTYDNEIAPGILDILVFVNCLLQGIDAGILIQQNLYAGNMEGKQKFSKPFVLLFMLLAFNIGHHWEWHALALSLPGAILIILGQKTVFGARKRGDYTMQNSGQANPYDKVFVYSWGEVFFMIGWILICWGMSMP